MARKKPPKKRLKDVGEFDLLTQQELVAWFRKSERTIERWRLPRLADGRYLVHDVIAALRARGQGAPA